MMIEEAEAAPAPQGYANLVAIAKMARRAGLSLSTLRYYTDAGLLSFITTKGGHKRYHEKVTLKRLSRIRRLIEQGWSLRQIHDDGGRIPVEREEKEGLSHPCQPQPDHAGFGRLESAKPAGRGGIGAPGA